MRSLLNDALSAPKVPGAYRLNIKVVYTDDKGTERALRQASRLAEGLDARLELIVAQVVPYALPLSRPDVDPGMRARKLGGMVEKLSEPASVSLYLCRDDQVLLDEVLPAGALVIVGGRRQARALQRRGHSVILADSAGGEQIAGRVLHACHAVAVRSLLALHQSLRTVVR